jgi:hypothetical protein
MPHYQTYYNGSRTVSRLVHKKMSQSEKIQSGGAAQVQPTVTVKNTIAPDKEPDVKAVRQKMAALLMKSL